MQYQDLRNGRFYLGDNVEVMRSIPEGVIDLTVTSPPYDNLREYTGESNWNWEKFTQVAQELYRVTKDGGIVCWIVADATVNGSETGTSFKQSLYAIECGFNLHDTMIWDKGGFSAVGSLRSRYAPVFEYMFIWSKGKPKTFNPIKDRVNKHGGKKASGTIRQKDGSTKPMSKSMVINEFGQRFNIWEQSPQRQVGGHPAPFPIELARDHILSWSNEGDVVLDPFMGSGTTACAAIETNRKWVGIEIAQEYADLAVERIKAHKQEKE